MDHLLLPPPLHTHFAFKQTRKKNLTVQQKHTTFIVMSKNEKALTQHSWLQVYLADGVEKPRSLS